MHRFNYKNNQLYCENVAINDIARRVRTPFYLYSHKTLIDHFIKIKNAFRSVKPLICFSMKANSNLAVLKTLVRRGAGLDIVNPSAQSCEVRQKVIQLLLPCAGGTGESRIPHPCRPNPTTQPLALDQDACEFSFAFPVLPSLPFGLKCSGQLYHTTVGLPGGLRSDCLAMLQSGKRIFTAHDVHPAADAST